jgi:hypothetical protein
MVSTRDATVRIIAPTTEHTRVVTTRLAPELAERLARTAAEEDRSQSSVIRRALRTHLAPRGRHAPEKEVAA